MKNKEIVIATGNQNKLREFKEMLEPMGYNVKSIKDFENIPDIVENGKTFEENATIKATTVSKALGLPVFADDSGLVVPSINKEHQTRNILWSRKFINVDMITGNVEYHESDNWDD